MPVGPASAVLRAYGIPTAAEPDPDRSIPLRSEARIGASLQRGLALDIQVAVRRDPTFGPLLHVGLAGQTALATVPLSVAAATELLDRMGSSALQAADLPAVVDLLVRLSRLANDRADVEIELEGVVVHARSEGVTVASVRLVELSGT